jgi:hypothetical protein
VIQHIAFGHEALAKCAVIECAAAVALASLATCPTLHTLDILLASHFNVTRERESETRRRPLDRLTAAVLALIAQAVVRDFTHSVVPRTVQAACGCGMRASDEAGGGPA